MAETKSLKALAQRVLERNGDRNDARNGVLITVPEGETAVERSETPEPEAVEMVFLYSGADGSGPAVEFPPCPVCGESRYWLASGGRVLCGSKRCASAQRFRLVALEFHAIS